jgi:hypothetical protein
MTANIVNRRELPNYRREYLAWPEEGRFNSGLTVGGEDFAVL